MPAILPSTPVSIARVSLSQASFQKIVKEKIIEYWQCQLAAECVSLPLLRFFGPYHASLLKPHPMWTSTPGNSFECSKSTVLARMVSGKYRTEMMCRFWSNNRYGHCLAETCRAVEGDILHLLAVCPALEHTRHRLHGLWCAKTLDCPPLHTLVIRILGSQPDIDILARFILNSTTFPEVIFLTQNLGQEIEDRVMYLTRTWAFALHRQKLRLLGRWPGEPSKNNIHTTNTTLLDTLPPSIDKDRFRDSDSVDVDRNPSTYCNNISLFSGRARAPLAASTSSTLVLHSSKDHSMTSMPFVPLPKTIVSLTDQPPIVLPALPCNIPTQSGSSAVEEDGSLHGGGGGHVVLGCGGGGGSGYQQPVSFDS